MVWSLRSLARWATVTGARLRPIARCAAALSAHQLNWIQTTLATKREIKPAACFNHTLKVFNYALYG